MIGWLHVALILVSAGFLSLLIFIIIRRWVRPKKRNDDVERAQNLHNVIARLHQVSPHHGHHLDSEASKKSNYHLFRRDGVPMNPAFSWADHPSLVTEAVENGWSRFAFAAFISSPSVKSARSLLGACAAGDDHESGVEIGWEVCEGSADFMQKIRLNPNVKKGVVSSSGSAAAVIRAALPLPGPNLGNSSFPQEAYFEVTILSCNENARNQSQREKRGKSEGDKIKLIDQDFNAKNSPDSLNLAAAASSHSQRRNKIEEIKVGKNEGVCLSLGLTCANPLPMRIPGSFAGSVGFNSTGSVYLSLLSLSPLSLSL